MSTIQSGVPSCVASDYEHWVELRRRMLDLKSEMDMRIELFGDDDLIRDIRDRSAYLIGLLGAVDVMESEDRTRIIVFFRVVNEDICQTRDPRLSEVSSFIRVAMIDGVEDAIRTL